MEVLHIQKYVHTSPRKLRLVADMVRKMKPTTAVSTLQFVNKRASDPLQKAIKTALANAKQVSLDTDKLSFKVLEINEGSRRVTRVKSSGQGMSRPYSKLTSHIRVVLTDEVKSSESKIESPGKNRNGNQETKNKTKKEDQP